MPEKNTKQLIKRNAEKYISQLKSGAINCRDFTDKTLSLLLKTANADIDGLPMAVRTELMYRNLIPLDFSRLDIQEQLCLLLRDEWYGLTPEDIGKMLKDTWQDFSPDMLVNILKYHPVIFQSWPDWDWNKTAQASPGAWCNLLKRHHFYAEHCPEETFAAFSDIERYNIAVNSPGIASKLNLNSLPLYVQDSILYARPQLTGFFNFAADDQPGKLYLNIDYNECSQKQFSATEKFLQKLFAYLDKIPASRHFLLGVFSQTRGRLLEFQINDFLDKNNIPDTAVRAEWEVMKQPIVTPINNLEAQILCMSPRIVEACMEEEKLTRIDVLLTADFELLRKDISCLLLKKAVSPELRKEAVAALVKKGADITFINMIKAADRSKCFLPIPKAQLLLALLAEGKADDCIQNLDEDIKIDILSVKDALHICRVNNISTVKKFFDNAITPMLRASLITELSELKNTDRGVGLVNILLRPYWKEKTPDEDFLDLVSFLWLE